MSIPALTAGLLARCTFPPPGTAVDCAFSGGADSTALVVLAQAAFTWLPQMQALFGSRAVGVGDVLLVTGVGIALMLVLEVEKVVLRRLDLFEELRA